uniref:Uncharacterized protein n=1 Tax=Bactrocera latifrons TaxID=174628 RepID=A0A0K8UEI3_BACLA
MSIREKLLMQKIKKREKMKKVLAEKKGKQSVKPSKKVESDEIDDDFSEAPEPLTKKAKVSKKKQQRQIEVVNSDSDSDSEGEPQQGKLSKRNCNFRSKKLMNFKANSKFLLNELMFKEIR